MAKVSPPTKRLGIIIAALTGLGLVLLWPHATASTLIGDTYIQPWKVLVVFLASAYVAISADVSDVFQYLTERLFNKQLPSRFALFVGVYIFAGILTLLASNDIVILTLTPMICYLARYQHLNVLPLLFAEFLAANSFSMMFYVGDPTNIIVANALDASFTEFAKVLFLPTAVSTVILIGTLVFHFRHDLRGRTKHKGVASSVRTVSTDMVVSGTLLVGMLGSFAAGELLNFEAWHIALAFAAVSLIKDCVVATRRQGYLQKIIAALPWKIMGLLVVLFMAVQYLTSLYMPTFLHTINSHGLFATIFGTAAIGTLLANTINNQPASILLTAGLRDGNSIAAPAAYAIVMATSLGATLSLVGTLAGLMWQRLLKIQGVHISRREYMRHAIVIVPPALIAGLVVLYLQFL